MSKIFQLNGHQYEWVATADDQSIHHLGKVVVYREVGTHSYLTMPISEMRASINPPKAIDETKLLELYKRRFVGRMDVFAERYWNKKQQRKAYSPAGPWENGHKSETRHYPLTDVVLKQHLSSQHKYAIGLYPMTVDNKTPFLAIDIDGHQKDQLWQALTISLHKVCITYKVPCLVEKSQSGNGSHVWIFFEKPLTANVARKLGDALLKATQSIDSRLPFSAFDRMFPSQDRIGGKQFGNLIAAPLEGMARLQGRGVFVDEQFQPLADQWDVLDRISTLTLDQVEEITNKIKSRVGFQVFESQKNAEPDLLNQPLQIDTPLTVFRSNALYISKENLSQQQILQLKWLASFKNPKFYEAQNNRMSVYNIPRIITLFQESERYIALPRGIEDELRGLVNNINWIDKTMTGSSIIVTFNGQLRLNQKSAFQALKAASTGILSARTGFGKTVIAAALIAERKVSTLVLVKNKTLAEQWRQRLSTFLTIDSNPVIEELTPTGRKRRKDKIGSYYGTKKNLSGLIDVATSQAVGKLDSKKLHDFLKLYGMVISDEVHHDSARTFDAVVKEVPSRYLYGLSATPYRRDGQEPIITMRFGPIRYQTEAIDPTFAKTVRRVVIPRFTNLGMTSFEMLNNGRTENNQAIMNDPQRNEMIINDCKEALSQGRHVIVLTELIAHVDQLYAQLPHEATFRIYGGFSAKQRGEEIQKLCAHEGGYVVLATISTAGEGLDVPTLDTVVLAMPISFHGRVEQVLGRLHRDLEHKKELRVYDYVDMFIPMLMRMYRKRCKTYRYLDYQITEDSRSKQKGLQVFNGNYQIDMLAGLDSCHEVMIVVPKLKPFTREMVGRLTNQDVIVQICTEEQLPEQVGAQVRWTQFEYGLPNCIVVDEQQLWLSADQGFDSNNGMTVRLDHPELIHAFKKMVEQTMTEFSGL